MVSPPCVLTVRLSGSTSTAASWIRLDQPDVALARSPQARGDGDSGGSPADDEDSVLAAGCHRSPPELLPAR
jgi:hypothetical protein